MLLTIIIFILILGLLVFVHELGHFVVARRMGIKAEEFGFGFPPRFFGIQIKNDKKWRFIWGGKPVSDFQDGGTVYSLNWVPLGGFVKIKGESGESMTDKESFAGRKIWQRASVLVAGVLMNVVAAAIILSIGFCVGIPSVIDEAELPAYAKIKDQHTELVDVLKDSPAALAGLEVGDVVVKIDNENIVASREVSAYLKDKLDMPVFVEVLRGEELVKKEITPIILSETGEAGIGVGLLEIGNVSYSPPLAIWHGILETGYYIKEIIKAFANVIYNLIIGEKVTVDVAGPVGIAVFTGKVARLGFIYLMQFTALLSVNLAIINIFPFPALDGGRLLFLLIEGIRRRPVSQKIENMVHNIGFTLLMILILFVTYRDIARFGGSFLDKFKNILH